MSPIAVGIVFVLCVQLASCDFGPCNINEQYLTCGSACPPTCESIGKAVPAGCGTGCVEGCFCLPGLVRDSNNRCVPPALCGRVQCSVGEVYLTCGSACPPTCANRGKALTVSCAAVCVPGCFCRPGLVRDFNNRCVPPALCGIGRCPINEVYSDCGTACPPTCDIPNPICTLQCVVGCFCRDGFIRNVQGGICIPPNVCPNIPTGDCQLQTVGNGSYNCTRVNQEVLKCDIYCDNNYQGRYTCQANVWNPLPLPYCVKRTS